MLAPRYTQWFKLEVASHVPLTEREAKVLNLALQRALETAPLESPLRDAAFNPARFTAATKN